jgi:hypothetical protein
MQDILWKWNIRDFISVVFMYCYMFVIVVTVHRTNKITFLRRFPWCVPPWSSMTTSAALRFTLWGCYLAYIGSYRRFGATYQSHFNGQAVQNCLNVEDELRGVEGTVFPTWFVGAVFGCGLNVRPAKGSHPRTGHEDPERSRCIALLFL